MVTQKDVAREAGVSKSLVSLWLKGERRISPEAAKKLAAARNCDPGVFVFGSIDEIRAALGLEN